MEYSLYALKEHDSTVDIQRPKEIDVRLTDGRQIDRSVVRVTVGEHGGITVSVAEGIVVTQDVPTE